MAVIHISESEAIRDISRIFAKVKDGEQVYVDDGETTLAITQASPVQRQYPTFSEAIHLAKERNTQVLLDDQFGNDMEEIIRRNREEPRRDPWEE